MNHGQYSYITKNDYEAVAGPSWPPYVDFVKNNNIPDFVYREIDAMLRPPEKFSHPSFCVLPFYGVEYPSKSPCCWLSLDADIDKVKQDMLSGKRPDACKECWDLEDVGISSDRILKNSTLDFYTNRNIKDLYQDCVDGKSKIIHYKIDTNNVCNATCVTCNSSASTAWAKLEFKHNIKSAKTWQKSPQEVDSVVDYSSAKIMSFRGGEPFMSKTNFHVMEKLIEHGNTDCFISFITNGSFNLSDQQLKLITKFKNVNFCFSIDGTGSVFEYLRYPLKFDTIENNIKFCRDYGIVPSVSYTLSNLNIFYHQQTTGWFKDNNLEYLICTVRDPSYFRPNALPEHVKKTISSADVTNETRLLFLEHSKQDDYDYERFKKEIVKQDKWKNIQLKHYLPDFAKLLGQ